MTRIAIQDANILIDLIKIGMFGHCLALDMQFVTTDIILEELYKEQKELVIAHVQSGKFLIVTTSGEELVALLKLAAKNRKMSEQDFSALQFAKNNSAILLSGDNEVRKEAIKMKIEIHGILWILDQLFKSKVTTIKDSIDKLTLLRKINKRLPQKACEDLKNKWQEQIYSETG
ncbi:MAG: hypothetical protein EOO20_25745 [Chryseobacterium sp.]|nr:MAG: hypothetical protein EOO20_25745 [Chryseobacterium sp.]